MQKTEEQPPGVGDPSSETDAATQDATERAQPSRSTVAGTLWTLALWLAIVELAWFLVHEFMRAAG